MNKEGLFIKVGDKVLVDGEYQEVIKIFDTPGHNLSYGGSMMKLASGQFISFFDSQEFDVEGYFPSCDLPKLDEFNLAVLKHPSFLELKNLLEPYVEYAAQWHPPSYPKYPCQWLSFSGVYIAPEDLANRILALQIKITQDCGETPDLRPIEKRCRQYGVFRL